MLRSIITTNTDVIVGIGKSLTPSPVEAGVYILDGAGFGLFDQKTYKDIEVPAHIVPEKYKYVNGEFVENENYEPPYDEEFNNVKENVDMLIELQADMIGGAI